MAKKTFQDTISYMFSLLPMYQNIGNKAFKKDLNNIKKLCNALENPQDHLEMIHIAGTNGKGSTTHILGSLLQIHNKKVGIYTSPHYKTFRERIKINNELISEEYVVEFIDKIDHLIIDLNPSFFEISVALAFKYFYDQKVDIAVIEVGLGGRLDSTNIIHPLLCVITNISLDHTQMLGNSIKEIASEKGGIIKKNTPIIIGESQSETIDVFKEIALKKEAPITFAEEHFNLYEDKNLIQIVHKHNEMSCSFSANWWNPFQAKNALSAYAAFQKYLDIKNLKSNPRGISRKLENMPDNTRFVGRWQWVSKNPRILADSAHNKAGFQYVFWNLAKEKYDKLHIILGFSNDKDFSGILNLFPTDARYYFTKANVPRGMNPQNLKQIASKYSLEGQTFNTVHDALIQAKKEAQPNDLIFVGGSVFVVAEVI